VDTRGTFQRARRPEQVQERRAVILATARDLLARRRAADVSLRELADEVGLAMSNVLRYFDSREAIFAQILDAEWRDWLDELAVALPTATRGLPEDGLARPRQAADAMAGTLLARPLLCELLSGIATILERNIPLDFTREFKRQSWANRERLGELVRAEFPSLRRDDAWNFAGAVVFTLAGLWPYTRPTDAVATVLAEAGMPPALESIGTTLRDMLVRQLIGTLALAAPGRDLLPEGFAARGPRPLRELSLRVSTTRPWGGRLAGRRRKAAGRRRRARSRPGSGCLAGSPSGAGLGNPPLGRSRPP
jgi:AcrR family transcriptional regulator